MHESHPRTGWLSSSSGSCRCRPRACGPARRRRSAAAPPSGRSTGVSGAGSGRFGSSPASFASSIALRSRRYSFSKSSGFHSPDEALDHLAARARARAPSARCSRRPPRSPPSSARRRRRRASRSASVSPCARMRQRFSLPQSTNLPTAAMPVSCIARSSSTYGPARSLGARRREVIRLVEVDRVDVLERDEAQDLDRLRALKRDRLEVRLLDDHELALRDLPALDELVRLDVALVERAPALLLDRRPALAVQGAKGRRPTAGSRGRARWGC